jgi:hypothetical protein
MYVEGEVVPSSVCVGQNPTCYYGKTMDKIE